MVDIGSLENPYGDDKVYDACGLIGIMDVTGKVFSGCEINRAITNMEERGNGLGAGFAVYGCYPEYADCYAFHVMITEKESKEPFETLLKERFILVHDEEIPHQSTQVPIKPPIVWRYFVRINPLDEKAALLGEDEYIVGQVMEVNTANRGVYIYSSGKNLGVFKGVGFPSQIADFFCIQDYTGYLWTAHNRFPTNTPGWWGGAHPFGILDWTVVHNGEISSYGTNRRYLEMMGYHCTMHTDTEVLAYAIDYLVRRNRLPIDLAARVMAPYFWDEIGRMQPKHQLLYRTLRQVYSGLLINGPFTTVFARQNEMIGLTDRIRLRPLVAAVNDTRLYLSSEEAAIRLVSPRLQRLWTPLGGVPVVGRLGEPLPGTEQYRAIPAGCSGGGEFPGRTWI